MAKAAKKAKKAKTVKKIVKKVAKKAIVKKAALKKTAKKAVKKLAKAVKTVKAANTVKKSKSKVSKAKAKKVTPVAKGYHSITPYLIINHAVAAIEFYKKAFGAKEMMRMEDHNGKIAHAELQIGDSKIMLADECHDHDHNHSADSDHCHASAVGIHLYIKDVDAVIEKAISAGAMLNRPVENMYYGDRAGTITDPFGHSWHVATHIEDVTPAQMRKRIAEIKAHCEAEANKA